MNVYHTLKNLSIVLSFVLLSFSCAKPNPAQKGECEMSSGVPFAIRLSINGDKGLRAILQNRSSVSQTFLHHTDLQPSKLVLTDATGREITFFDVRSIEKFDNTVYRRLYAELLPGKEQLLHEEKFRADGKGRYKILWGPYQYEGLTAGSYKAHVRWTSALDSWFDEETKQKGRMDNIWKGQIKSNEVEIRLP
jgi:hypothetical protein